MIYRDFWDELTCNAMKMVDSVEGFKSHTTTQISSCLGNQFTTSNTNTLRLELLKEKSSKLPTDCNKICYSVWANLNSETFQTHRFLPANQTATFWILIFTNSVKFGTLQLSTSNSVSVMIAIIVCKRNKPSKHVQYSRLWSTGQTIFAFCIRDVQSADQ